MFGWVSSGLILVAVLVVISRTPPLLGKRGQRSLTGPIGKVAGVYARFMVLYLVGGAFWIFRSSSRNGPACVDTPLSYLHRLNHGYPPSLPTGVYPRQGGSLAVVGDIQACAPHPGLAQWSLYLLTRLPGLVLWGCLLVLILRLISQTDRSGPFTPRAAATMRQLGWLVIAGSMVVAAASTIGADLLMQMLVTPPLFDASTVIFDALLAAVKALFPVPALAGAALITFGRITGVGVVLDEEIKATV
jgi:hypothetical protein